MRPFSIQIANEDEVFLWPALSLRPSQRALGLQDWPTDGPGSIKADLQDRGAPEAAGDAGLAFRQASVREANENDVITGFPIKHFCPVS